MKKLMVIGMSLALGGAIALAKGKAQGKTELKGDIDAKSGSTMKGTYDFTEKGKEVKLVVKVTGAPEGEHAVHIHENADCSDPEGKKAGGHWNPNAEAHGQWAHDHFHLGDVGNMKVGKDGKGEVTLSTDKWTIASGDPKTDVAGHAIVVHEKIDDFKTQPTGNAGNRIGCGVIPAPGPAKAGGDGSGSGGGTGGGTGGGQTK